MLQEEKGYKSKEIKKMRTPGGSKGPKSSNLLVQGLKRRVTLLQKENKTLKEALDALKKSLKMTNAQELNEEIKVYKDECARLRSLVDKGEEKSEEKKGKNKLSEKQNKLIDELKAENKELDKKLQKALKDASSQKSEVDEKKNSLEVANKQLTKEVQSLKEQIESVKKADNAKKEELQKLKDKIVKQEDYEKKIKILEKELAEHKKAPPKEQPKEEQKKVEKMVDAISKEEIKIPSTQLRLNLILAGIEPKDIRKVILKGLGNDKKMSIHDLSNSLTSTPASLKHEDALKVARYLIEPRTKQVVLNELLDKTVSTIEEGFIGLIGKYRLDCKNNPEVVQESLLKKINEKLEPFADQLQNSANDNGNITLEKLEKIFKDMKFDLTQEEYDYIVLIMYKENKDLQKMCYETFVQHLSELLNKLLENAEEEGESRGTPSNEKDKSPIKEPQMDTKKGEEKSSAQKSDDEMENSPEEEIISLVQNCLTEIAKKIIEKQVDPEKLFKDKVYKKRIDGEEMELISPENFIKAIKNIGVGELGPVEKTCLTKMLAASEKEPGLKVAEIIKILKDHCAGGNEDNEEGDMNLEDLDKVSLVLLLALSEYLTNTNTTLNKVFENVIYKQPVQIDDQELEIEIINSHDFFEAINNIGIETEESQHENLKMYLCIDPNYIDKCSVDKLRMVMNEFKTNEELQEQAKEYYQEFVEEDENQMYNCL